MELLAYILFTFFGVFSLIISIFIAIIIIPIVGQRSKVLTFILLVPVSIVFLYSLVNLIRPHLIDGMLINSLGQRTKAKVVRIEQTSNMHNDQPVQRHHVIFKDAAGNNITTYFDTWDFNIYPSANSVRYPQTGEEFTAVYLPSYPTAFLIATSDDSQYSQGEKCRDALQDVQEAKLKADFDPKDADFQRHLEAARKRSAELGCETGTR